MIDKDRQLYGLSLLYTRPPIWKPIGGYAYLGTDDMGDQVFVNDKSLGRYDRISNSAFDDDSQPLYRRKEGKYTVHHVDSSFKSLSDLYPRPKFKLSPQDRSFFGLAK